MNKRRSGILLHIISLPSAYGIGDFGPEAYKFADFLSQTRQCYWQMLPLTPVQKTNGYSPYSSSSIFAGNPLLLSPDLMREEGLLTANDLAPKPPFPAKTINYRMTIKYKTGLFFQAFKRFKQDNSGDYERFCSENIYWLEDFACFAAFREYFRNRPWHKWPQDIRDRKEPALSDLKKRCRDRIKKEKFLQYVFFKQWFSLKNHCNRKGIDIIGDIPIYPNYAGADVWSHPEIFKLDKRKKPLFVAGVPPDYFNRTGQLWRNPVYNWDKLRQSDYSWWTQRIEHNLRLFNVVRIDHFRGLFSYWEVPSGEKSAINGQWVPGPADDFFNNLAKKFPALPFIAEDLGVITQDIKEAIARFGFPGMKVLLFAFGEDPPENPYLPHNYPSHCVVYTGTHDNNTVAGWFKQDASAADKKRLFDYLGRLVPDKEVPWEFVKLATTSKADTVIIPLQDILGLNQTARMNRPGTNENNYRWRFLPEWLTAAIKKRLLEITESSGRILDQNHGL